MLAVDEKVNPEKRKEGRKAERDVWEGRKETN
jgi:hypothetical protein